MIRKKCVGKNCKQRIDDTCATVEEKEKRYLKHGNFCSDCLDSIAVILARRSRQRHDLVLKLENKGFTFNQIERELEKMLSQELRELFIKPDNLTAE